MSWLRLMEERMKENEASPDAETEGTAPLPAARKKNKIIHLVKEMWPAYLIEILVIILGISITLALEEWRDGSKEKKLEAIYLESLQADIQQDIQSLEHTSAATQKIIDQGNTLLALTRNPANDTFSVSGTEAAIVAILGRPKFVSNDATFSDLKSSGNLHLLEDTRLKNSLFAYYNMVQNIKDDQDAEQQATITLSGSYFLKQIPLYHPGSQQGDGGSMIINNLSKNIEFGNNVLLRVATRMELHELYQRADSAAIRLRDVLAGMTRG